MDKGTEYLLELLEEVKNMSIKEYNELYESCEKNKIQSF